MQLDKAAAAVANAISKPADPWMKNLFAPDPRKVYSGKELLTIGMPCGGVAAGQLYVRGDGTLAYWWIFNNTKNTGYGDKCYLTYKPPSPVDQGFAIRVKPANAPAVVRKLAESDFDAIEFIGEYPIAEIRYKTREKPALPVAITSEVFSPFIPLNARDSAMPVTVLRYTVKNTSNTSVDVSLAGWLQNAVCLDRAGVPGLLSRNRIVRQSNFTSVQLDLIEADPPATREARRTTVFEDFEKGTYEGWTIAGEGFADKPSAGTSPNQQQVAGFKGKFLVNTYRPDDNPQGTLTSKPFKITEPFLTFLIGGGRLPQRTCLNLLINGKVVRTATGENEEALRPKYWAVSEFLGQDAQLQIVDKESGPWGHINIDDIQLTNLPPGFAFGLPKEHPGFGDMALTALDPQATVTGAWTGEQAFLDDLADDGKLTAGDPKPYPLGAKRCAAVASSVQLAPGESKTLTFLVSWNFPNRPNVGQMYSNWFANSVDAAQYVSDNFDRLSADTHLFRDTFFDTTLPYWFIARLGMPISILATETCQWWKNGRFYAWEGVGCCEGTCTHVWNYDHAGARLFPELERSTRMMQDLSVAFDAKTGLVGFRGNRAYAADGQCGTVLKTYREHLTSPDNKFLNAVWPRVRKVLEYSISHDANEDGIIEDIQHNTYDINFVGPNTFVGSLYLAALRAGEEMARLQGDEPLAARYHAIFEKGSKYSAEKLFNGEYFIHLIPPGQKDQHQYGTGCLADQVFGQGWAHQINLGYIYPQDKVLSALRSVFKYCWTSDIGPYNKIFPPQRWFIRDGEAGLFTATWPRGNRPAEPVLYRDEVWTGIEYQVAGHMLYEGLLPEAFAIVRGIHERYDGADHNPWNEVECGDHYARAMASWGCLTAAAGFLYDGPANKFGFSPRLTPDNFKSFFTAAEAWGNLTQTRGNNRQLNRIEVKWGRLRAQTLLFDLPASAKSPKAIVTLAGQQLHSQLTQNGLRVTLTLNDPVTANRNDAIVVELSWN